MTEVLQATYALIGDLAMSCFERLRNFLPTILPELVEQVSDDPALASVANNAIWAAGEIAMAWGPDMQPFIEPLLQRLLPLLSNQGVQKTIMENTMITIGRLGLSGPEILARHLHVFIKPWLQRSLLLPRENEEKDTAFQGLCQVIKANPQGIADVCILQLDLFLLYLTCHFHIATCVSIDCDSRLATSFSSIAQVIW